jgi:hypothetical protein
MDSRQWIKAGVEPLSDTVGEAPPVERHKLSSVPFDSPDASGPRERGHHAHITKRRLRVDLAMAATFSTAAANAQQAANV